MSDDRPCVLGQNRPQFASFIQISGDRLININGQIPKNRQIAETSLSNLEVVMVGVTLSPDQIRNAPPEVRRWLEQELLAAFGLQQPTTGVEAPQLAACSVEESAAVLSLIQGMLAVVNVFFELGREGIAVEGEDLTAFSVTDILRHTRLQTVEQVIACLDTISAAVRRIRGGSSAAFYGLDNRGHCFISAQTQRSILQVRQQVIAARHLDASTVDASGVPSNEPNMASPVAHSGVGGLSSPIWSMPGPTPNGADQGTPSIAPGSISP
jgi:hypothetical protein